MHRATYAPASASILSFPQITLEIILPVAHLLTFAAVPQSQTSLQTFLTPRRPSLDTEGNADGWHRRWEEVAMAGLLIFTVVLQTTWCISCMTSTKPR